MELQASLATLGTVRARPGTRAIAMSGGSSPVTYTPKSPMRRIRALTTSRCIPLMQHRGVGLSRRTLHAGILAPSPWILPQTFAYIANEASNNVSIASINPNSGVLTLLGATPGGMLPVAMAVEPSGRFAYVANQGSNNLSMYTINSLTSALTPAGTIPRVPVCLPSLADPTGRLSMP